MSVSLEDYRAAIALGEERHFGRAARRLGVTQPALTARLRRLEAAIETRLFDRGRGGAAPTAAGLAFLDGARRVLDAAAETHEAAQGAAAGRGQVLRIGATHYAAHQVLGAVLTRFRARHPDVRIKLKEGATARLEAALERRELDAAFAHPPLHCSELSDRLLAETRFIRFERSAGDPLIPYPRAEAPVLMGALARAEEARSQNARGRDAHARDARGRDARSVALAEADTMLGAITLAEAGYGTCAAPEDFPHRALAGWRRDEDRAEILQTSIAWRRLDRRPQVTALISAAMEAVCAAPSRSTERTDAPGDDDA
ncbi:MAG: LysR family transcriptional regulator [Pseudomonadota bacterium]